MLAEKNESASAGRLPTCCSVDRTKSLLLFILYNALRKIKSQDYAVTVNKPSTYCLFVARKATSRLCMCNKA